jgi:hypothetical protein
MDKRVIRKKRILDNKEKGMIMKKRKMKRRIRN